MLLLLVFCVDAQTFEIAGKDTFNRLDASGQRQGLWRILNTSLKLPNYAPDQLVEEVFFVNDKMDGIRKQFYPDGVLKSETTFAGNAARGYMKIYHTNGRMAEEGMWLNASWDGPYKSYYEDGSLSYAWNYKEGRREGEQAYFLNDGSLDYIGIWKDGKEVAKASPIQPASRSTADSSVANNAIEQAAKNAAPASKQDQLGALNGFYAAKDKAGRITREGLFKEGFLMNGKCYEYDSYGNCLRILIISDTRVIKRVACD